jgi:hypothetical protein
MCARHLSIERRNAVTVGIAFRITHLLRDPSLKCFRDEMLQALRLIMDFSERVIQYPVKKCLHQSVMTHDFKSPLAAESREADALPKFVTNERLSFSGKFLQHVCDGGWSNLETHREFGATDAALFIPTKAVNCFQVIIDRFAALLALGDVCFHRWLSTFCTRVRIA